MRLMIDLKEKPIAYRSPLPVPIHWQDDVKAGLDRDVRLCVLEPVPIGEPVMWYHRMAICAKKNGKPRRTIDFQSFNIHETHFASFRQSSGLISVEEVPSHLTQGNLYSLKMLCNLQDLR